MSDIEIPSDDLDLMLAGLEDFDVSSDAGIPRMTIDSDVNAFVDSLSGEEYNPLTCILLGLVKQRVLWPLQMGSEPSPPLCKARVVKEGGLPGEDFPWEHTDFDKGSYVEGTLLDCGSCKLAAWESRPDDNDTPWCTEQYVVPAMVPVGDGAMAPSILTFQRSSLGAVRKYISAAVRAKQPLFTHQVTITLDQQKRGKVVYSTPTFKKGAATDKDLWRDYASNFMTIRNYLTATREVAELETSTEVMAEIAKASKPKPPPVAEISDDDIPFDE